eukprot:7719617-Pyramimonas_sp.AAC.1
MGENRRNVLLSSKDWHSDSLGKVYRASDFLGKHIVEWMVADCGQEITTESQIAKISHIPRHYGRP